jgi:aspartyl aminopeptidase
MRVKLGEKNDNVMLPYTIPGYGKPWNNTWLGINYSLYYQIPLYKKKKTEVETTKVIEQKKPR